MRILVVTDQWSPDVVGGSARVAADTARALAGRGHEVTVLAPVMRELPALERNDVEVRRSIRRSFLPQTYSDVAETWRLAADARSFDLVVAHQATNAVGVLARRIPAPLVFVYHASAPLEQRLLRPRLSPSRQVVSLALQPSLVLLERLAVRGSDGILVLSEFSRGLLLAAHPGAEDRTTLVTGGVDVETFNAVSPAARLELRRRHEVPTDRPFLLSARRLEPRMGLEELLRAARLLVDGGTELTLGVVGDGRLAGPLRALAAELELGERVRFFGRVGDEALHDLYAAADLFVLPTLAFEGFGMATVEALASGTPVVGTAVGATPELLTPLEPRLVAPAAAPPQLRDTIRWALANLDEQFRERCADYARTRYAWGNAIDGWDTALRGVAAAPRTRRRRLAAAS